MTANYLSTDCLWTDRLYFRLSYAMDDIHTRLARNLRALRHKTGLSQEAFADEAGLHRTYMSDLERGNRNPSIAIIEKLARALGVPAGKLLD